MIAMANTLAVTISGIIFYIEEEGHLLLQDYLKPIKASLQKNNKKELLYETESQIAEIFLDYLHKDKPHLEVEEVAKALEKIRITL
jgi:hypothetical protein